MASTTEEIQPQSLDSTEPDYSPELANSREEDESNKSDDSEVSDGSSDSNEGIDSSVVEDMAKLEYIFDRKGLMFRFIDRIGEGMMMSCATLCIICC